MGIKNHYLSLAHPQANVQVEVTNQSLLKIIKTWFKGVKGIWLNELPNVLLEYWMMAHTLTSKTPFCLTFGSEAIILVDVELTSHKVAHHDEERNEEGMHLQLDLLDEVRAMAEQWIAHY